MNFGLFQVGWFVCVLGAASGHPWSATAAGIFLVLVHPALVRHPVQEILLLGTTLLLGVIVDTLHIRTGVPLFSLGAVHPSLPPAWIFVLWLLFAMTLHYSLAWLTGRYVSGAILGSFSGALAYWAGVRFGAASFNADLLRCLVQIGLSWGLVMVILLRVAEKTTTPASTHIYRVFAGK